MATSLNFGIRLPRELLERVDQRADAEDRSRNKVIVRELEARFGMGRQDAAHANGHDGGHEEPA